MGVDQQLGKMGYLMIGVLGGYAKSNSPNGSSYDHVDHLLRTELSINDGLANNTLIE